MAAAASGVSAAPFVVTTSTSSSSSSSCSSPSCDGDFVSSVRWTNCHVAMTRSSTGKKCRRWMYGGGRGSSSTLTSISNRFLNSGWQLANGKTGGRGGGGGGGGGHAAVMAVKPGSVKPPQVDWREKREELLSKKVRSIGPSEALRLMKEGGYSLLDVRLASEHEEEHPEGAINVEVFRMIKEWTPWDVARRAAFAFFGIFKGTEENPDFVDGVRAKLGGEDTPIIVACFQGGTLKPSVNFPEGKPSRSLTAACRLVQAGYTNVLHLEEGLYRWYNEGMP